MGKRKATNDIAPDRAAKSPRNDFVPSVSATASADSEGASPNPTASTAPKPMKSGLCAMLRVAPWDPSSIPTMRPALPPIADAEIEAAVFRHSSVARAGQENYEQLEFVGDAYLELLSTELINHTFRGIITPGRCAQVRELLIRNVTLAEYARAYGLEARISASHDMVGRSPAERTKMAADAFEAYVAGLVESDPANGLKRVAEWLRDLWAMTIEKQLREVARGVGAEGDAGATMSKVLSTGKSTGIKDRLQTLIVVPKLVKLRYEHTRQPTKTKDKQPLFHMGVYLDGWGEYNKLLGTGSGLSRVEASERAAQTALANKKLMKQYESEKATYMAMKARAQQDGEGQEGEGNQEGEGEGEGKEEVT